MARFVASLGEASHGRMLELARAVNAALRGDCANTGLLDVPEGAERVTVRDARCRAGRLALLISLDEDAARARWHLAGMERGSMTFAFDAAPGPCRFGWMLGGGEKGGNFA